MAWRPIVSNLLLLLNLSRIHRRDESGPLDFILMISFLGMGVYQLVRWKRAGLSLPGYAHVLAAVGAVAGLVTGVATVRAGHDGTAALVAYPIVLVVLVYLAFGFYGRKSMIERHPDVDSDFF